MQMYQVDAFTTRVFAGNPAAVLSLPGPIAPALMQAIAAENNLAETAFTWPEGPVRRLRWFTPLMEVAFCGHATLATAHVLFTEEDPVPEGPLRFETEVGRIEVARRETGYCLDLPRFDPEPAGDLPTAVRHAAQAGGPVFRNFENWFVEMPGLAELLDYVPHPSLAALGRAGLCLTTQIRPEEVAGLCAERHPGVLHHEALIAGRDVASRYFAPGAGIPEDPVTGSTHATLAPYWAGRLGRDRLLACQLSSRGGALELQLLPDRVQVSGAAVTYCRAELSQAVRQALAAGTAG